MGGLWPSSFVSYQRSTYGSHTPTCQQRSNSPNTQCLSDHTFLILPPWPPFIGSQLRSPRLIVASVVDIDVTQERRGHVHPVRRTNKGGQYPSIQPSNFVPLVSLKSNKTSDRRYWKTTYIASQLQKLLKPFVRLPRDARSATSRRTICHSTTRYWARSLINQKAWIRTCEAS